MPFLLEQGSKEIKQTDIPMKENKNTLSYEEKDVFCKIV